jgi:hypothetical protein
VAVSGIAMNKRRLKKGEIIGTLDLIIKVHLALNFWRNGLFSVIGLKQPRKRVWFNPVPAGFFCCIFAVEVF